MAKVHIPVHPVHPVMVSVPVSIDSQDIQDVDFGHFIGGVAGIQA
jgi:hypothetical protein